MRHFLTKYTYLFFLALLILLPLKEYFFPMTWDLNRTIGWGWDVTNFAWYFQFHLLELLLFTLGYGLLFLMKRHTIFFLSALQIALFLLELLLLNSNYAVFLVFI